MTQLSQQFSQPCPCGGRTAHPHSARSLKHEASKMHQRWLNQGQTTSQTNQTTPTRDVPSTCSSQSTSWKAEEVK